MGFHGSGWRAFLYQSEEKPHLTRKMLKRVLGYSRPYVWKIIGMLLMILISSGLNLLNPLILRDLIDRTIPEADIQRLILLAAALLLIPILRGGVTIYQRWLNSTVGEGVIFDLRMELYTRLQQMSLRFFTHTKVGELMSRLNNDVIGAQNAISNTIVNIITNIIQAAAVLAVMIALEWRLTLVSITILPFFILFARRMAVRLRDVAREQLNAIAELNASLNETLNIGGILLIKLFGRAARERESVHNRAARVRDAGVDRAILGVSFFVIISLLSAIGTALVYGIGGYLVIRETFTIGTIVAFGTYMMTLYSSLQGLTNAPVEFAASVVSFERVFEVLDLALDIQESPSAIAMAKVQGDLVFENVSFRYEIDENLLLQNVERHGSMDNVRTVLSDSRQAGNQEKKSSGEEEQDRYTAFPRFAVSEANLNAENTQARQEALEEISFRVEPGQLAALVGPSGAGKTTLTYLIPRLYDPTTGRILIDGLDIRQATLESLSRQIGMVTQETHLFHDTIRMNLLFARHDASEEQIVTAARAANIHDFILGLPEGYNTIVGERGYRLSGGEKQRIALARVILKDPRILVLDEATSHLDSESEALIQEALKYVMASRTSIVIAHRLSTILTADLILVMDRGRIVERGTHQELLRMGGLYTHLYNTQFRRE